MPLLSSFLVIPLVLVNSTNHFDCIVCYCNLSSPLMAYLYGHFYRFSCSFCFSSVKSLQTRLHFSIFFFLVLVPDSHVGHLLFCTQVPVQWNVKTLSLIVSRLRFPIIRLDGGAPLMSQHSRSQTLLKEEGCVRRGEPM